MTLAQILAIMAGILVEVLLLWEAADRTGRTHSGWGVLSPPPGLLRELIGWVVAGSWLLILLAGALFPAEGLPVTDLLANLTMFVSFSFLFVFGMVVPRLMPQVSEQTVVVINLVVLLGLYLGGSFPSGWMLAVLLLPSLGVLIIAFSQRIIHPYIKSFFYFWYLVCLLIVTIQNDFSLFFSPATELQSPLEFYVAGAAGIFLLLHAIFLVRFFLMLSALIIPRNRKLIVGIMPQLFTDEQMPRSRFLLVLVLAAALMLASHFIDIASPMTVTSVLILLVVHGLERAPTLLDHRI